MDNNSWSPQSPDLSSYYVASEPVHPQHQGYRGSISHIAPPFPPPNSSPTLHSQPAPTPYMPRGVKKEESLQMQDADYMPDASAAPMADAGNGVGGADMLNPDNITIKNHFPVARIKRIMQADDDVGKVAQVTPVVVSKALELFMISLVTKAAAEAKARNSKRVASVHLKQAITKTDRFDFLSEIVAKVADAPEKNDDAMDVDGKKKRAASRRKKTKAESDEDF